jgi:hypothetical protein
MQDKRIIIGIVVAIAVIAGGIFFFLTNKESVPEPIQRTIEEEVIQTLEPEDIGLDLSLSKNETEAVLEIIDTEDIAEIEYELSYSAKGDVPRGVIGHIEVDSPGDAISEEITLGTCSDVCHYDEDVTDIKVILKVIKLDGSTYQVTKSL